MAVIVPTLKFERRLWREGLTRVVGVDEVGVAPTCGAVLAAAVIMRPNCHRIPGVRDSKTLSAAQRERLAPRIRARAVAIGVGAASVREIDQLNIYHATHLAMRRAIARVGEHEHVLVDGNRITGFEALVGPYTNIVDGDAKVYSIACASVVAKFVRDRMMTLLAARYPGYGWERNQGYATLEHRRAIRRMGLTPFHRRSFLALQRTLAGDQVSLDLFGEGQDAAFLDPRMPDDALPLDEGHARRVDRRPGAGSGPISRRREAAATVARCAPTPSGWETPPSGSSPSGSSKQAGRCSVGMSTSGGTSST
jgi:ribonuclease HII